MKFIKKRCNRCGRVADIKARQRRCYERRFGKGSYACWGNLEVVRKPRRPRKDDIQIPAGKGIGWVLSEEADRQRADRARAEARRQLDRTNEAIVDKTRAVTRLARSIDLLQQKARRLKKRSEMSDVEFAGLRERGVKAHAAKVARRGTKRGIALGKESP